MKVIFSFLFMCLLSLDLAGQPGLVFGRVVDAKTKSPLETVEVSWNKDSNEKQFTNKHGFYYISDAKVGNKLIFKLEGKEIMEVLLREKDYKEINVELEDKGATSITASRWEQSINETPASIVIITREEIEQRGFLSLQEILESVPGVYTIDHRSESDVTIGIRGFWGPFNRNVMIQVNGVNMLNERQNDYPLNKINVPVESIDKIEIVRGPMSVIYGAGAFFGVINIITNDADTDTRGMIAGGVGTQSTKKGFLRYALNRKGVKLSFNGMWSGRDGFEELWDDMISQEMYERNLDDTTLLAPTLQPYKGLSINKERYAKSRRSFNLAVNYDGFFTSVNYAISTFGFSFLHPGPSEVNEYKSKTVHSQFGYRGSLKALNGFEYEIKIGNMFSKVDATYKYFFDDSYTPGIDNVSSIRTELNTRQLLFEKGDNIQGDLIFGLSFNRNLENNSVYNAAEFGLRNWYIGLPEDEHLDTKALYMQTNLKLNRFSIVAGGRFEQQGSYEMVNEFNLDIQDPLVSPVFVHDVNPNDQINFIPRLALIYALTDSTASGQKREISQFFKLMYGEAIKQATVIDNAADVMGFQELPPDSIIPYLRPEQIRTIEFGYVFEHEKSGLDINFNLFRNDLLDLVTREASISNGDYLTKSTNSGELVTHGAELILNKRFDLNNKVRGLSVLTNFDLTYQQTNAVDGAEKSDSVSFSPALLGELSMTGIYKKMSLNVSLNYVGGMKSFIQPTSGTVDAPVPAKYIGHDTPGYFRLGFNFRINDIQPFKKSVSRGFYFNIRGSNLLNIKYLYPTYTLNPWADKGMLGRARQVFITIGYKL